MPLALRHPLNAVTGVQDMHTDGSEPRDAEAGPCYNERQPPLMDAISGRALPPTSLYSRR